MKQGGGERWKKGVENGAKGWEKGEKKGVEGRKGEKGCERWNKG